jgi:hypothetical protein
MLTFPARIIPTLKFWTIAVEARLLDLRERHRGKRTFLERLDQAGLVGRPDSVTLQGKAGET